MAVAREPGIAQPVLPRIRLETALQPHHRRDACLIDRKDTRAHPRHDRRAERARFGHLRPGERLARWAFSTIFAVVFM
jgi:hypothetical protein